MKLFFSTPIYSVSSRAFISSSSKRCSLVMNRGRSRGWFSNVLQTSPSSSSNHDSSNYPIQDRFSALAIGSDRPSQIGTPQETRSSQWGVESSWSRNPQETQVVDYSNDRRRPYQNASHGKATASSTKSPDRVIQQKGRASVAHCYSVQAMHTAQSSSFVGPFDIGRGRAKGRYTSEHSKNGIPHPRQITPKREDSPQVSQRGLQSNCLRNPLEKQIVDYSNDRKRASLDVYRGKGISSRTERHQPVTPLESITHHNSRAPPLVAHCCFVQSMHTAPSSDAVRSSEIGWNIGICHNTSENSKYRTPQHGKMSSKREDGQRSPEHSDTNTNTPFHICVMQHGTPVLKNSLLVSNREKRREIERSINDPRKTILRPGMVLLKNCISHADQIKIIKTCEQLGGEDGFYQPGYSDGAKLRLHMMCLGKDWDPEKTSYGDIRSDGFKPPLIPTELKEMVSDAILASHAKMRDLGVMNPREAVPCMEPDICIVNFYTNNGKLGLHQDIDESAESIGKGLPVVSFSIGDSAEFLYGDDRAPEKAKKAELKSGDVVIFGGKSRLIFHGVPSIIPDSAPKFLAEEANLRRGRLNLTFRKF